MKSFQKLYSIAILLCTFVYPPLLAEAKASTLSNSINQQSIEAETNLIGSQTEELVIAKRPIGRRRVVRPVRNRGFIRSVGRRRFVHPVGRRRFVHPVGRRQFVRPFENRRFVRPVAPRRVIHRY